MGGRAVLGAVAAAAGGAAGVATSVCMCDGGATPATPTEVASRTVGVISRDDARMQAGYTLFSAGRETYLVDEDGRVVHQWRSSRGVFCAHLLPNGNLLRDGSELLEAPFFDYPGGYVEEVTWDNEPVWSFAAQPNTSLLCHHEFQPLPNGNVLVLCWERKSKEEALAAGRRPDLLPDGEIWNDLVIEIAPNGSGGAQVVWQWSMWDHLVQDFDHRRVNYGNVSEHPELFDINYCPNGGKIALRNADLLQDGQRANPSPLKTAGRGKPGKTGEKVWLHMNALSYDPVEDRVFLSANSACEVLVLDHSLTTDEARGHVGGRSRRGGDILHRLGNPKVSRGGSCTDQVLFSQHGVSLLRNVPGDGNVLLFNNGRSPDRQWTTVDEFEIPPGACAGGGRAGVRGPTRASPVWSFGPALNRLGSFYSTHLGGCQRLPNGNTLVTVGPQGIVFEVSAGGEEVWRYVCPVTSNDDVVACVRQGDQRVNGRFYLFRALRYDPDYPGLCGKHLTPGRHLEA